MGQGNIGDPLHALNGLTIAGERKFWWPELVCGRMNRPVQSAWSRVLIQEPSTMLRSSRMMGRFLSCLIVKTSILTETMHCAGGGRKRIPVTEIRPLPVWHRSRVFLQQRGGSPTATVSDGKPPRWLPSSGPGKINVTSMRIRSVCLGPGFSRGAPLGSSDHAGKAC